MNIPPPKGPPAAKKQPPKSDEPCRSIYQETGSYCAVIVAMCRATPQSKEMLTAAVMVAYTKDGGSAAADESVRILIKYFGGKPQLSLMSMSKIEGRPLYLFAVLGVKKLPKRLPGYRAPKPKPGVSF